MNPRSKKLLIGSVVLLTAALLALWKFKNQAPPSKDVSVPLANVAETVWQKREDYRKNTACWSLAFHGSFLAAALLSVTSSLILKLESVDERRLREKLRKDIAAGCAGLAALLLTVSGTMNFNRKWETNRVAAYQTENLYYEISSASSNDLQRIYRRLQEIVARQNEGVLGLDSVSTNAPGSAVKP